MASGDATPDAGRLPGRVLGRVVGSVVNPIVDNVDIDEVVERIDLNRLLERVDLTEVLEQIDVNRVLDRIDPDRLLDRVDPDRLLDRVDPNRLLDRVDVDALVARVDPDRLLERVDVNAIVDRTELGAVIARSTTGVFTQLLDVARTQIVLADQVVQGIPGRILRGAPRELPPVPGLPDDHLASGGMTQSERAVAVQGRSAGSLSRFLAFLIDQFAIASLFALGAFLVGLAIRVVIGTEIDPDDIRVALVVLYTVWAFTYTAGMLATTGRTIGKVVLGLLVTCAAGSRLDARHAIVRTLAFPISFLVFGVGFLIGLARRDRRELHDLIADTAVIYAWDAGTAAIRADALTVDPSLSPSRTGR